MLLATEYNLKLTQPKCIPIPLFVVEAMDFDGRTFGRDRLNQSVLRHGEAEAPTLAQQLLWDVRRFAGLARQSDDITMVVARIG